MSQAFHGGRLIEAKERFGDQAFLDFSVNTNAFWHPPTAFAAVPLSEAITRYPEADANSVRLLLADLFDVRADHILATAGAIEGLYLAVRLFTKKRALIFAPSFADYSRACLSAGLEIKTGSLFPDPPDAEQFVQWALSVDVVILGNPNNPTGRLFTNLLEVVLHPKLSHLHWIIDEAFIEFVPEPERHSLLPKIERLPNVLVLRALTKSWSVPGLRLGFLATANLSWLAQLRAMQPPWPLCGVAESWANANFNKPTLAAVHESLRALAPERERFSTALSALPGLFPLASDANFLLVETRGINARDLADTLGRGGILVRVCVGFLELEPERYFRLAVRTALENDRLIEALRSLSKAPSYHHKQLKKKKMRAISVLGTSSNSGKSWVATALCAWLRRRGVRVAPFKAQNMSNNSAVALDGGEIGRAQAVQAEACGLPPSVRMNPILLKPSGTSGSQLVVLGRAQGHIRASTYYEAIESLRPVVTDSLSYWEGRCDALILEGAGSPVELNLMQRDLVNLWPVRELDGRWLLVADIERGGVFAQVAGTWGLLQGCDRQRCAGLIVNKFRGDLSLFADAKRYFAPHFGAPFFGTLPYVAHLQPENEDSLSDEPVVNIQGEPIHWIKFPYLSNSQDTNPWQLDDGVRVEWVCHPASLASARIVVLPGSKNTLADLAWLRSSGLADAVLAAHQRGALIIGICGGFQMLGQYLSDPEGIAGERGEMLGLGLLPVETLFFEEKQLETVKVRFEDEVWDAYEIHMGRTTASRTVAPLLTVLEEGAERAEGACHNGVWGTYLHGVFESSRIRLAATQTAGLLGHRASPVAFRAQRETLYNGMADLIEEHLNLEDLWRYVAD
jgi:adenosylcobyric acid synthase